MTEDRFGEARSILARGPSSKTFDYLIERFRAKPIAPPLLQYVSDHLARWPKSIERALPQGDAWLRSDALAWCTHIRRHEIHIKEKVIRAMAASGHLGALRSVELSGGRLTTKPLVAFLSAPELGALEVFDCSGSNNDLKASVCDVLLDVCDVSGLKTLRLSGNERVWRRLLDRLPALNTLKRVEQLGASGLSVDVSQLFETTHFVRLRSLDLSGSTLSMSEPLKRRVLPEIKALDLSGNRSALQWLSVLANAGMGALTSLSLDRCGLTAENMAQLAGLLSLSPGLKALSIESNDLTLGDLDTLLAQTQLTELRSLSFRGNVFDFDHVQQERLRRFPRWNIPQATRDAVLDDMFDHAHLYTDVWE